AVQLGGLELEREQVRELAGFRAARDRQVRLLLLDLLLLLLDLPGRERLVLVPVAGGLLPLLPLRRRTIDQPGGAAVGVVAEVVLPGAPAAAARALPEPVAGAPPDG